MSLDGPAVAFFVLPMMYMDDAIDATVQLMQNDNISRFESYNIGAVSFSPAELADEIRKSIEDFVIQYNPDSRQEIANSWPQSVDDSVARKDWNWSPKMELEDIVKAMFEGLNYKVR